MWKFLLMLFSPHVEEEPEEIVEEIEEIEAEDAEEIQEDSEEDIQEEVPEPKLSRAQKDIITTRERAQKAELELAKAKAELEVARRPTSTQPTQEQLVWQQEEDVLKNPEATDWQRYAVQSTRAARAAEANSRNALQRAEDLADKASFERIRSEKPKLYELYKDRVEELLGELRSKGNNAPREKLLAIVVGEAMLAGKLKAADVKATPSSAKRVSTPKSDVGASSGRMTESEKRAKRLENIRI